MKSNPFWKKLREYAAEKEIQIIGDIPIYVAYDSADTWANQELFQLDGNGQPINVAGCPPDAFSATGQLWGNPLYRWEYHSETEYAWWMKRIAYCYKLYDVVRIDHFRGFDEYYSIPYGDATAEFGHWEKGPGYDSFKTMKAKLGNKAVIAEDLGFLTDTVIKLVKKTGYPGMKILDICQIDEEQEQNEASVREMFCRYPDVNVVYVVNPRDYEICRTVAKMDAKGQVKIITNDLVEDLEELMRQGSVSATICQEPEKQGEQSLEILFQYLAYCTLPKEKMCYTDLSIHIAQNL